MHFSSSMTGPFSPRLIAFAVPYGFAIGIVIGGALYALSEKFGVMTDRPAGK